MRENISADLVILLRMSRKSVINVFMRVLRVVGDSYLLLVL